MGRVVVAIEAAWTPVSVALARRDGSVVSAEAEGSRDPLPLLAGLLGREGIAAKDIARIVVDRGPGSYTGLRVAIAAARTLARFIPCELASVTSLEAIARAAQERHALPAGSLLLPLLDARRGRLAGAVLAVEAGGLRFVSLPAAKTAAEWSALVPEDALLCGEGAVLLGATSRTTLPAEPPRAAHVLALGSDRAAEDPTRLEPLYLMASAAEERARSKTAGDPV